MSNYQKEPKLTYALNKFGKMVCIDSVDRGRDCNCFCPKCNERLIAKLGKGKRQPHFSHQKESNCHGSYMTALHMLGEQIIRDEKAVMAPEYKDIPNHLFSFKHVEVEQRTDRNDMQPDLVGITEDDKRWHIEIRNTHEVDETKINKIKESNITCLEIDVKEQTLENLKSFLLESTENRKWINNPYYEKQIEEAKQKVVSEIVNFILKKPNLLIPEYGDFESKTISLEEASIISKTDNGLFVRVKTVSSDGIVYNFNIGNSQIIKKERKSLELEKDKEHNELAIFADDLPIDVDNISDCPRMMWLNFTITEKVFTDYETNPKYEVLPLSECKSGSICNLSLSQGKCIYKIKSLPYRGVEYVVCDKEKRLKTKAEYSSNHHCYSTSTFYDRRKTSIQEILLRESSHNDLVVYQPKQKEQDKHELSSFSTLSHLDDNLSIEPYWTIEKYYDYLVSNGFYETETGERSELVKHEFSFLPNGEKVLIVLYKTANEDKASIQRLYPYHIAIIKTNQGNLEKNKVVDFRAKETAIKSYHERLTSMKGNEKKYQAEEDDEELPF